MYKKIELTGKIKIVVDKKDAKQIKGYTIRREIPSYPRC